MTSLSALLRGKCPRCRTGNMFQYPISRISRFSQMHDTCPHCGVSLSPEPGFYQGAMYVSYAFIVALIVAVSIVLYTIGANSEATYIISIISLTVLLAPLNFRYSRIVYLYLFGGIKFDSSST